MVQLIAMSCDRNLMVQSIAISCEREQFDGTVNCYELWQRGISCYNTKSITISYTVGFTASSLPLGGMLDCEPTWAYRRITWIIYTCLSVQHWRGRNQVVIYMSSYKWQWRSWHGTTRTALTNRFPIAWFVELDTGDVRVADSSTTLSIGHSSTQWQNGYLTYG